MPRPIWSIEEMRALAKSRGGECLSDVYTHGKSKLKWRCARGHIWESTPQNVRYHGAWCRRCKDIDRALVTEPQKLTELRSLAISKGGECLSEKYSGNATKLKWRCAKGHVWEAVPSSVKNQGTWCPKCARGDTFGLKDMQRLASERGGRCLSREYKDLKTKLTWLCAEGHVWQTMPLLVSNRGSWCPTCARGCRYSIEDLRKLAASRGGECLSNKYKGIRSSHLWRCAEGHIWKAAADNVLRGRWCQECGGSLPLTIEHFHQLAELEGGRCLSSVYKNQRTRLNLVCRLGHRWTTSAVSLTLGTWCPYCAGTRISLETVREFASNHGGVCHADSFRNKRQPLEWSCKAGHRWTANFNTMRNRKSFCLKCRE